MALRTTSGEIWNYVTNQTLTEDETLMLKDLYEKKEPKPERKIRRDDDGFYDDFEYEESWD